MQIIDYRVPLAQVIQSQLILDSTNSIAYYIGFNLDMLFQIKVLKDRQLCKYMS